MLAIVEHEVRRLAATAGASPKTGTAPESKLAPRIPPAIKSLNLLADKFLVSLQADGGAADLMKELRSQFTDTYPDLPPTFDRRMR
ncbi:MAG TPA: hypothetical protein VMD98_11395, partial [Bryocella sp.]|nr:hypothetical protein [Bryocella sp.]